MRTLLVALAAALVLAVPAGAGDIVGFTEQVSPRADENATEPYIAIDRSDGTIYVAWQSGGSHVARSDDGGRTFTTVFDQHDVGDVDVAVGGPTPCTLPSNGCVPGTRRVYLTSIEETPLPLQTHLAYSDDRGATWTVNELAALNPSAIDRPWLAVYPGSVATSDKVYIGYHDFTISQIWVAASIDGGQTFGPSEDTFSDVHAQSETFCNSIPSGLEVDPNTGEVYIQWITAGPVQNAQGCDLTQNQNFHEVWIAHSAGAGGTPFTTWDDHLVFDGPEDTNADKIFADIAVDSAGNVYSVFPDNLAAPDHFVAIDRVQRELHRSRGARHPPRDVELRRWGEQHDKLWPRRLGHTVGVALICRRGNLHLEAHCHRRRRRRRSGHRDRHGANHPGCPEQDRRSGERPQLPERRAEEQPDRQAQCGVRVGGAWRQQGLQQPAERLPERVPG